MIIIQRHGEYQGGEPEAGLGKSSKEEQQILGHLTPEGIDGVRVRTQERLKEINNISERKFLIVHSPTYWLDDPKLSQRAYETSVIIAEEIQWAGGEITENRLDSRLGEALFFQTPFAEWLREKCGGQGAKFWTEFYCDIYREKRILFGAESSRDIAERVHLAMCNIIEMVKMNDDLVVWVVTHGESTAAYGSWKLGIPIEKIPYGYNDGFRIIDNTVIVSGEEHYCPALANF